jgi:hypothetical protein
MPKVGGGGGNNTATAECPAPEFAIGLSYRCGSYGNSIQLKCGKVSNGTIVPTRVTSFAGATGGGSVLSSQCSEAGKFNAAITQIKTRADLYVDQIGPQTCTRLNANATPPTMTTGVYAVGGNCNNSGHGVVQFATCPIGEVLFKVVVKYGLWMDSFQGYCRKP